MMEQVNSTALLYRSPLCLVEQQLTKNHKIVLVTVEIIGMSEEQPFAHGQALPAAVALAMVRNLNLP